jgi:hypothetical protein
MMGTVVPYKTEKQIENVPKVQLFFRELLSLPNQIRSSDTWPPGKGTQKTSRKMLLFCCLPTVIVALNNTVSDVDDRFRSFHDRFPASDLSLNDPHHRTTQTKPIILASPVPTSNLITP